MVGLAVVGAPVVGVRVGRALLGAVGARLGTLLGAVGARLGTLVAVVGALLGLLVRAKLGTRLGRGVGARLGLLVVGARLGLPVGASLLLGGPPLVGASAPSVGAALLGFAVGLRAVGARVVGVALVGAALVGAPLLGALLLGAPLLGASLPGPTGVAWLSPACCEPALLADSLDLTLKPTPTPTATPTTTATSAAATSRHRMREAVAQAPAAGCAPASLSFILPPLGGRQPVSWTSPKPMRRGPSFSGPPFRALLFGPFSRSRAGRTGRLTPRRTCAALACSCVLMPLALLPRASKSCLVVLVFPPAAALM